MCVEDPLRAALNAVDASVLSLADDNYPPLLREIPDPPPLLYARGDLSLLREPQLAIVGARSATVAGLKLAEQIAATVVEAGLHICSGLARGVDGAAHRGALRGGGKTVAVMASGIDILYPARHRALGEDICRAGCLITEFPPGVTPRPEFFPRRNRIISGMSLGTLVVEAALPSGSLITAQTALEQGREVFALPWSPAHKGGAGCLKLLRDGAKMVTRVDDILEELGALHGLQLDLLQQAEAGTTTRSAVLDLLGCEVVTLDGLIEASGSPAAEVVAELSRLELGGHIERSAGGYIRVV
ncbi:DNA-protecting protein DprA [Halioglobus maricola]|uniref:DNA-protecting protein DprA n=1 Tax=Halioglobus maricola TaxID=2601894 RepID=A0A5P9NFB3_9GAMM|nr:DNA-processing protein DprA [Halioglobus maricola]QFU74176.1 DNA-protecting protein DprA [Halioglobus maricola]